MASVKVIPILAAAALFVGQPAHAQFTYITPNGSGGYMMNTSGYQPNNAPMFPRYGQ